MAITVDERLKPVFVRVVGPNKLFAVFGKDDKTKRKTLRDFEATALFDKVWHHHNLEGQIANAEVADSKKAHKRLIPTFREHFSWQEEHREFRYQELELEFIAQVRPHNEGYQLTQLWPIQSRDYDPRMLPVWFEDADQKKQFDGLARMLGHRSGSDLAKEILLDFMRKFPSSMIGDAVQQFALEDDE